MATAGEVAVIFTPRRTGADEPGYATAAIDALAARQPGYRGIESARGAAGGIPVSYWADEAAALAWCDQPDHAAIRDAGRARWCGRYAVTVASVTRNDAWSAE